MKIVILVLDSFTKNSIRNSSIQKKTWAKSLDKDIKVYFYKGGNSFKLNGVDLIVPADDSYDFMGIKTLKAFEWVEKNHKYDFIFRTNTSSYVNTYNLKKFLVSNKNKINYSGVLGKDESFNYVGGSGIILSRNSILSILNHSEKLDEKIVDDVAIGRLLRLNGIIATKGLRYDIENPQNLLNLDLETYHYRCRIDTFGYSRFLEKFIIFAIHHKLNNESAYFTIKFLSIYMTINKYFLKIIKISKIYLKRFNSLVSFVNFIKKIKLPIKIIL